MFWSIVCACVCVYVSLRYFIRSLRIAGLTEKYVVISGCDSGFGNLLAKRLDTMGMNVIAGCLTQAGIEDIRRSSSGRVTALKLDITKDEDVKNIVIKVKEILPPDTGLWGLVNNAGVLGPLGMVDCLTKYHFLKVMEVNLFGHIEMVNHFLPLLRMSKGRIVTMISIAGRFASFPVPCYVASKFALEGYSDLLRNQLYSSGVSVHIVEPGGNRTPMIDLDTLEQNMNYTFSNADADVQQFYGQDYMTELHSKTLCNTPSGAVISPERVVNDYIHALTARFPRTRYVVGMFSQLLILPLTHLPDFVGDFLVRQLYPTPAALRRS